LKHHQDFIESVLRKNKESILSKDEGVEAPYSNGVTRNILEPTFRLGHNSLTIFEGRQRRGANPFFTVRPQSLLTKQKTMKTKLESSD
jgi:hypothetical protein